MLRTALMFTLLTAIPFFAAAAPVATLSSLEGEVTVLRSGVLIPSERVTEGFPVEAFDTLSTGATGRADVRFAAGLGIAGSLRLDASTSLYLDLTSLKREQAVGVELLSGAVSVRISATTGTSSVEIRTDLGTFSSVGPSFRVVTTPVGDVLVTTTAGRVVCQFPLRTVFIEPGSLVQVSMLERIPQTLPMNVSTLDAFEGSWQRQRTQNVRDQVAVAFRTLAGQYQLQVGLFQRAWERVQRESKDDEKAFRAAVGNLRRAAFPLERTLFRIRALKALYESGVLSPSVELSRGYSAKDFFRQAAADDALWSSRLGEARGLYKAMADASGGSFPKPSDGTVITGDSDYFH